MSASKGMTLIEVVIVVAIIALFLGAVCGVLVNFLWSSATGENYLTASRVHERTMSVMTTELVQACGLTPGDDPRLPGFRIYDENGDEVRCLPGNDEGPPGVRIKFKKFCSLSIDARGIGTSNYFTTTDDATKYYSWIEFYRDSDPDSPTRDRVMRRQWEWPIGTDELLDGSWGEWRAIGSFCKELTFTELPARRVKITMRNEVGDPNRHYFGSTSATAVGVYSNSVEVSPEN